MAAGRAASTILELFQRQAYPAAVQFLHQHDGVRLDHMIAAAAGDAKIVALSGAFVDRIELVANHVDCWNKARTKVNGGFPTAPGNGMAIRMRNPDDLARSVRARAMRCTDTRHSTLLHRLADEAGSIQSFGPAVRLK